MKRFFLFLATAMLTLSTAGCGGDDYDDAALKQQIAELEKRIAAAETVLNAYNNNLFINKHQFINNHYLYKMMKKQCQCFSLFLDSLLVLHGFLVWLGILNQVLRKQEHMQIFQRFVLLYLQ